MQRENIFSLSWEDLLQRTGNVPAPAPVPTALAPIPTPAVPTPMEISPAPAATAVSRSQPPEGMEVDQDDAATARAAEEAASKALEDEIMAQLNASAEEEARAKEAAASAAEKAINERRRVKAAEVAAAAVAKEAAEAKKARIEQSDKEKRAKQPVKPQGEQTARQLEYNRQREARKANKDLMARQEEARRKEREGTEHSEKTVDTALGAILPGLLFTKQIKFDDIYSQLGDEEHAYGIACQMLKILMDSQTAAPQAAIFTVESNAPPTRIHRYKAASSALSALSGDVQTKVIDRLVMLVKGKPVEAAFDKWAKTNSVVEKQRQIEEFFVRSGKVNPFKKVVQGEIRSEVAKYDQNIVKVVVKSRELGTSCQTWYNTLKPILVPETSDGNLSALLQRLVASKESLNNVFKMLREARACSCLSDSIKAQLDTIIDVVSGIEAVDTEQRTAEEMQRNMEKSERIATETRKAEEENKRKEHMMHMFDDNSTDYVAPVLLEEEKETTKEEMLVLSKADEDEISSYIIHEVKKDTIEGCGDPSVATDEDIAVANRRMFSNIQPFDINVKMATINGLMARLLNGVIDMQVVDDIKRVVLDTAIELIAPHVHYETPYDTANWVAPIGLTQLVMFGRGELNEGFPVTSSYTMRGFNSIVKKMAVHGSIYRINYESDWVFECLKNCAEPKIDAVMPTFYPMFSTSTSMHPKTDGTTPIIAKPHDESEFAICDWSPSPVLMATRDAGHTPNLGEYIVPATIREVVSYWSMMLFPNRLFLVQNGDKNNGCGYRMGRFIGSGSGTEDNYFAWMAEMGTFKDSFFYPRQHVTIFFTHRRQAEWNTFVRRIDIQGSDTLLPYCGAINVRCCVGGEQNRYENQDWLGVVMPRTDGTLRTFLDGPDIEMAGCDDSWVYPKHYKEVVLKYFTDPTHKSMGRFDTSTFSMENLWSRALTAVYTLGGILRCTDKQVFGTNPKLCNYNMCPEDIVYSTNGFSLSAGPVSLSLIGRNKGKRMHFARMVPEHIITSRRMLRGTTYNFMTLNIGGTCVSRDVKDPLEFAEEESTICDWWTRCLGNNAEHAALYPTMHSSDPFVPYWSLTPEAREWFGRITDMAIRNVIRRHIMAEQQMVLMRYVALKMKLGFLYGVEDVNRAMARMQYTPAALAHQIAPNNIPAFTQLISQLYTHAQKRGDMALFIAQCFFVNSGAVTKWLPCFDAVKSTMDDLLKNVKHNGQTLTNLFSALETQISLQSPVMGYIANNTVITHDMAKALWGFGSDRRIAVSKALNLIMEATNKRVAPGAEFYIIDKTPLK